VPSTKASSPKWAVVIRLLIAGFLGCRARGGPVGHTRFPA
jgi:hypothetical protein